MPRASRSGAKAKQSPAAPATPPPPPSDSSSSDSDSGDDEALTSAINVASAAISLKFSSAPRGAGNERGNELTFLIPGYTAPMSLTGKAPPLYIDYDPKAKTAPAKDPGAPAEDAALVPASLLGSAAGAGAVPAVNGVKKRASDPTAGGGWHGFQSQLSGLPGAAGAAAAEALKRDLSVIRQRNFLDPKKFYKSADKASKHAQLGTVIESGAEFYSGRLAKRERRGTVMEEVMADERTREYARRKFGEIQGRKESGGRKWKRGMEKKRGKGGTFGSRKTFS